MALVASESGWDRGDELRRQAHRLAHASAWEHIRELRRIESALLTAATTGGEVSALVEDFALDIIRTHMVRGLVQAQFETGNRATYWVGTSR